MIYFKLLQFLKLLSEKRTCHNENILMRSSWDENRRYEKLINENIHNEKLLNTRTNPSEGFMIRTLEYKYLAISGRSNISSTWW